MPPVAFLFDLDGTISDPAVGFCRSVNYALVALGHSALPDDEISRYIGPPIEDTFHRIVGSASREHVLSLVAKYRERYGAVGWAENRLYPGIPDAIRALAARGIPLGICTTKRADFAERILVRFELRGFFSALSGGDVGISKKDQIAGLLDEGRASTESTMIGDRAVDMAAARANGLRAVGVLWGYGTEEELRQAHPDLLLRAPDELAGLA